MKRTENGNPYYYSNTGTKIGLSLAGVTGGLALLVPGMNNLSEKIIKKNTIISSEDKAKTLEVIKNNKNFSKKLLIPTIATMAMHITCGALVDMIRNNNAKKSADLVRKAGINKAMIQDENIEISQNNRPYYNSSSGAKYGALLGAVAMPLTGLICDTAPQLSKGLKICSNAVSGAICGVILGAITDYFANKKADKLS